MRRGSVTPELVLAMALLVLAMVAAFEVARGVAAVWGVHRAAEAALLTIRLEGEGADPAAAAAAALAGTPLLPADPSAARLTVDPPAGWRFGAWVCVTVDLPWEAGGGLLPRLALAPSATRCGPVERWP